MLLLIAGCMLTATGAGASKHGDGICDHQGQPRGDPESVPAAAHLHSTLSRYLLVHLV